MITFIYAVWLFLFKDGDEGLGKYKYEPESEVN